MFARVFESLMRFFMMGRGGLDRYLGLTFASAASRPLVLLNSKNNHGKNDGLLGASFFLRERFSGYKPNF